MGCSDGPPRSPFARLPQSTVFPGRQNPGRREGWFNYVLGRSFANPGWAAKRVRRCLGAAPLGLMEVVQLMEKEAEGLPSSGVDGNAVDYSKYHPSRTSTWNHGFCCDVGFPRVVH